MHHSGNKEYIIINSSLFSIAGYILIHKVTLREHLKTHKNYKENPRVILVHLHKLLSVLYEIISC